MKGKRNLLHKLTLLLILFATTAFSQEIEWQNTIGGNGYDELYSLQQTTDGGYILGGSSSSDISGDKTELCIGTGSDYWIVKIDSLGSILWQNAIGGYLNDVLVSIQQTSDGGFILGGYSQSDVSGDKTENCLGLESYWIVKTDSVGNIQWQNTIGGNGYDKLCSIQQTTDGGFILGGSSTSDISGDKTENNLGSLYDFWIVKTDSLGQILWQNTIGGINNDFLISIKETTDGGFILGGSSNSNISGDKTENCLGDEDYWIVKTDSLGNIQWQNTIGGSQRDVMLNIQQTFDSGYIVVGRSNSTISGDKIENCYGDWDYWIIKTDSTGNIQWQNTIGGSSFDNLSSIKQTVDGGYILGGWSSSSISGNKTENCLGLVDNWVVKIDFLGNILWQNTIGGSSDDYLNTINLTANGDYILGGYSNSNKSEDKDENSLGSSDYWIVKLNDKYNLIKGKLFVDFNSNGIQDNGEPQLPAQKITESSTGRFAFSERNGNYIS
ncbi:MAG: T9SS C-terminal target domain-containing protein [Bacteroidetes bacterium]|nr:T9SS C-terminal target domain-containing protein [Bacteroidota bacterium]